MKPDYIMLESSSGLGRLVSASKQWFKSILQYLITRYNIIFTIVGSLIEWLSISPLVESKIKG